MSVGRLRVGLSARLLHEPPRELGFRGKTLQYLEQSVAHWLLAHDALAFMIPAIARGAGVSRSSVILRDYVRSLDGLVLQGKPVLGIRRGHQLIDVALGRRLRVEAVTPADGVVEAIRWKGSSYAVGLQWHPEFHQSGGSRLLDGSPVLVEFLEQAARVRAAAV